MDARMQRLRLPSRMPTARPTPSSLRFGQARLRVVSRPAVAIPMAPSAPPEASEALKARAAELGYSRIGQELPPNVSLTDIVRTLPPEVFELNHARAWSGVLITLASMSACLYAISVAPWYLLPLAWAVAGTAFTGFFVVGHDAGHRSFHKNNLVEDVVGHLMFAPLLYPFEPWRIKHNHHHAHTNKLGEDTAWHPVPAATVASWGPAEAALWRTFLGTPLKLWASVGHQLIWHFDLALFTAKQRPRVMVSLAVVAAFALIALPALALTTGWWGLVKFWLMPWLGYHFWMSTFTVVHHTAPHIPFRAAGDWNAAEAQLTGTVHCDFPAWVEFLTHDISWHVPHHVSSKIPWYNLRKATASLRQNWGQYMTECSFNWRMMKNIFLQCHMYDEEANYKAFDHAAEEPMFAVQRKFFPDTM